MTCSENLLQAEAILRARQSFMKYGHQREEHFGRYFLIDFGIFLKSEVLLALSGPEHCNKESVNLLLIPGAILEIDSLALVVPI